MPDQETTQKLDALNKLTEALNQIQQGDSVSALRNELQIRFNAILTRFEGIDIATRLQHEDMVRVPTLLDQAIGSLRALLEQELETTKASFKGEIGTLSAEMMQRFAAISAQSNDRNLVMDQRAVDIRRALDDAYTSAKEATAKIEDGFTERIDGMMVIINTKTDNLTGSIADLKERFITLESRTGTTRDVHGDFRGTLGLIVAAIAAAIAAVALAIRFH